MGELLMIAQAGQDPADWWDLSLAGLIGWAIAAACVVYIIWHDRPGDTEPLRTLPESTPLDARKTLLRVRCKHCGEFALYPLMPDAPVVCPWCGKRPKGDDETVASEGGGEAGGASK